MSSSQYAGKGNMKSNSRSNVLFYELELKEIFQRHKASPCRERAEDSFRILGEVIPLLGIYSNVVGVIKDELYRSVYSKNLTSSKSTEEHVERIPFFKNAARLEYLRVDESGKMKNSQMDLEQKLKFREQGLLIAHRKSLALKQELFERDMKVQQLIAKIAILEKTCHQEDSEKMEIRIIGFQKEKELEAKMDIQTVALAQANLIIEKLSVFKSTSVDNNDSLQEESISAKKIALELHPKAMLEYDILQGEKLIQQFAEMIDLQLDDFEFNLSQLQRKKEILCIKDSIQTNDSSHNLEIHNINFTFRKRIHDISEEQALLQKHLSELRNSLEQSKEESQGFKRFGNDGLRRHCVQLLFSTDKGITFNMLKDTNYCVKCAEKTIICPHRTGPSIAVVPEKATHFRFEQISFKFNKYLKLEKQNSNETLHDSSKVWKGFHKKMDPTFGQIWMEFYDIKKAQKPRLARLFMISKLLNLIEEIYGARWAFEDGLKEEEFMKRDKRLKFSEFFYDFMEMRYQPQEISYKVIYDVISSLYVHCEKNLRCKLFSRNLCGKDDYSWKYLKLAEKLLAKFDHLDAKSYRQYLQILYPSRSAKIYEQMELEFIAFSRNRYSRELIGDHILHMMDVKIEPNISFFLKVLGKTDVQRIGTLSFEDFDEGKTLILWLVIGHILPSVSTDSKKCHFVMAKGFEVGSNTATLEKLAQAASFIGLKCCHDNKWVPQTLMTAEMLEICKPETLQDSNAKDERQDELIQSEVNGAMTDGATASKVFKQAEIDEEAYKINRKLEMMFQSDDCN